MAKHDGRFVWHELVTDAQDKARSFYPELFGWKLNPMKMADGSEYPLLSAGDVPIGGFMAPPKAGVPPHWVGYIAVDDVDATAKKVASAGGKSLMDAFDVQGVGRIQPVSDPQGGVVMLFKPAGDSPAASGNGSFHWDELWAADASAALAFYEQAFGYEHDSMDMPTGKYYVLKRGGTPCGGLMQRPDAKVPHMWLSYVEVADCDRTVKQASGRGASQLGETMEVPGVGRFAILRDPLGAVIGVIRPAKG
ncbi:MAG: VOC family protein [Polyangiaceae bacterium]